MDARNSARALGRIQRRFSRLILAGRKLGRLRQPITATRARDVLAIGDNRFTFADFMFLLAPENLILFSVRDVNELVLRKLGYF